MIDPAEMADIYYSKLRRWAVAEVEAKLVAYAQYTDATLTYWETVRHILKGKQQ